METPLSTLTLDDPRERRVVIIGAGAAGLSALSAVSRLARCNVVLLEQSDDLGGVWQQCDYPGLATHVKGFSYKFYDFDAPPSIGEHATRDEVIDYFSSYATSRNLNRHIHYGKRVVRITNYEHDRVVHKCHVEVEDCKTGERYVLRCDYLICALGFTNAGKAIVPDLRGRERFRGSILHSSEFDSEQLAKIVRERAKVCLVGAGKSAYDLALQFLRNGAGTQLTWVYRKFLWGFNYDVLYSDDAELRNKLGQMYNEYMYVLRRSPASPVAQSLAKKLVEMQVLLSVEDNHNIHETRYAIYKPDEIAHLRSQIKRVVASIDVCDEHSARLTNSQVVDADYILCCTGYARANNVPPIRVHTADGDCMLVDPTDSELLYRGMIDARLPRIIMFTGEALFSTQVFGLSIAGEWVAKYIDDAGSENRRLEATTIIRCVDEDEVAINGRVASQYRYTWAHRNKQIAQGISYFTGEASLRYLQQVLTDLGVAGDIALEMFSASLDRRHFERVNRLLVSSLGRPR